MTLTPLREPHLTRTETVDAVAGVLAELMFAVLPLLVVLIIMVYRNEGSRVFTSPEWSFGSAILCGQALVKFVSGLARARQPNWQRVAFAVAALFVFGVVPALTILALMIVSEHSLQPWLARAQVFVFLLSMAEFFIFGTIGDLWHGRQSKE